MNRKTITNPARRLKKGDLVMIIAGGNNSSRPLVGKTGKILKFVGERKDRALLEGVNMVTRHQRPMGPGKPAGKIQKEGSIHVSNLRYYAESIGKPVKLVYDFKDGSKVRGFRHPETGEFVEA